MVELEEIRESSEDEDTDTLRAGVYARNPDDPILDTTILALRCFENTSCIRIEEGQVEDVDIIFFNGEIPGSISFITLKKTHLVPVTGFKITERNKNGEWSTKPSFEGLVQIKNYIKKHFPLVPNTLSETNTLRIGIYAKNPDDPILVITMMALNHFKKENINCIQIKEEKDTHHLHVIFFDKKTILPPYFKALNNTNLVGIGCFKTRVVTKWITSVSHEGSREVKRYIEKHFSFVPLIPPKIDSLRIGVYERNLDHPIFNILQNAVQALKKGKINCVQITDEKDAREIDVVFLSKKTVVPRNSQVLKRNFVSIQGLESELQNEIGEREITETVIRYIKHYFSSRKR